MFQPTCRFQCHFMWRVPLELTWPAERCQRRSCREVWIWRCPGPATSGACWTCTAPGTGGGHSECQSHRSHVFINWFLELFRYKLNIYIIIYIYIMFFNDALNLSRLHHDLSWAWLGHGQSSTRWLALKLTEKRAKGRWLHIVTLFQKMWGFVKETSAVCRIQLQLCSTT